MVEPVDPFEGGVFNGVEAAPWPAAVDDLGLEQTIDRFGKGIVIRNWRQAKLQVTSK
jgi:hypothetical protein